MLTAIGSGWICVSTASHLGSEDRHSIHHGLRGHISPSVSVGVRLVGWCKISASATGAVWPVHLGDRRRTAMRELLGRYSWPLVSLGGLLALACLASTLYINRLQSDLAQTVRHD